MPKSLKGRGRTKGEEGEFGLACIPGREFDFQMNVKQAIEYAYGLGCPRVHILAGLTNDNFMDDDFRRVYVNNLRCAAEMLEEYCLTGLIGPISPTVKENYFLHSFETAVQILEELQSPQVKLLLDIYHLKMLTGTVSGLVDYLQYSDYIQVSQMPGYHESSCKGEINYQEVFDLLEQHYSGHIGLEYKLSGDDDSDASSEDDEPIRKKSERPTPPDVEDDESQIQVQDQKPTYDSSNDDDKDSIKEDGSKGESEDENEEDDDSDASSEDHEPIEKRSKMPSPPDIKDDESKIQVEDQESTYDSSKDDDKDSIKEDVSKDESEDENEEVCLLDRSVEITGCRARKKIEHLDLSFPTPKEKQELPLGKGQKLGECPQIKFQIQRNKLPDLKPLHRILFNRLGSGNEIKKNIRKFCGFAFEKNSKEYERKKATVERLTAPILKHVCEVLDLKRSGTKEEIVLRILEFLLNPKDSGKKVPSKKKLSSGHEKRKSKGKKSKNSKKKVKTKKEVSDDDEKEDEEPESPDTTMDVCEDGSEDDVDESDDEPKRKSKNISKTKETCGKGKAKKNEKVANKMKKEEKRTVGKGSKRKHDDDSDASSEDDEPIRKKIKMPTDDEIKALVCQILDEADLREMTMKIVIKQVSDAYPDFDLSHKKAFIKTTIKSHLLQCLA